MTNFTLPPVGTIVEVSIREWSGSVFGTPWAAGVVNDHDWNGMEIALVDGGFVHTANPRVHWRPPANAATAPWWMVLGFGAQRPPHLTAAHIKAQYHKQARKAHSDAGGSTTGMQAINAAYDQACKALGIPR